MPLASLNPKVSSFRPTGQKILVRPQDGAREVGGIWLPDNQVKVGLGRGDVLAVGEKVEHVAPGDVVLFPIQLGFNRVEVDGKDCRVVPMDSVYAVEAAQ
ncbi:MAG: hypothetical protein KGL39_36095 [Patescibacteria group bacterium]|nr:hypothetical protein [Patescibacteria group bacterium]